MCGYAEQLILLNALNGDQDAVTSKVAEMLPRRRIWRGPPGREMRKAWLSDDAGALGPPEFDRLYGLALDVGREWWEAERRAVHGFAAEQADIINATGARPQ